MLIVCVTGAVGQVAESLDVYDVRVGKQDIAGGAALDLDEAQGLVSGGRGDELRDRLRRRLIEDGVA